MVTRFLTTASNPKRSRNLRVNPPSNKMMATEKEIKGRKSGSRMSSGLTRPKIGPTTMPVRRRKIIAGSFTRQATH
jgi:hypothetical protein